MFQQEAIKGGVLATAWHAPSYSHTSEDVEITLGVYELGSVFKTFTIAAALEKGIVDIDNEFQNLEIKITLIFSEFW